MTVKQFSDKYKIPYNIVYSATYEVKPLDNIDNIHEYDEQELKEAVRVILYSMWKRSQQNARRYAEYKSQLNKIKV